MTNVLYICPSAGVGGAETFLKQSFTYCDKEKFKNHYFLFDTGPLYDALKAQGASVYLASQRPRISSLSDQNLIRKQIRKIIDEENIKIVHSTMAYAAIFAAWAAKQMNVKHVWFQHGPVGGWMSRLASILPHTGLIVNSHYTSEQQRKVENPFRFIIPRCLPIEKILLGTEVQPPASDELNSFKSQLFSKYNLSSDTLVISMLCRIQEWKGVHVLLDAIKILQDQMDLKFHCFIWGKAFKGKSYFESLENQIQSQKLPATLAGHSENVALPLSLSNILVNASIEPEPFGLSIIEGMMLGAVPVVPNEGGPIEIVSHGTDGLHFKSRQPEDLAYQLKTLLTDSNLREKLSQEAQSKAENKFHAKRAIQHLEQFYQKVLST